MKILAKLPDEKHYSLVNERNSLFEFVDKANDNYRMVSPVVNPFDKEWVVSINTRQAKSDRVKYVIGVTFKLFHISPDNIETEKGIILKELYKSRLAYSQNETRMFYAAPCTQTNIWIAYSIILKNE